MISAQASEPGAAEYDLAARYGPPAARPAVIALLSLDRRLGGIVRRAGDPTIGLMRLTWWGEALAALDREPPPAEPLLRALAAAGVRGAPLGEMIEGWAVLLEGDPVDVPALERFARERGGRLFGALGEALGATDPRVGVLGEGWALADLATHLTDPAVVALARSMAAARLARCNEARWPRDLRTLGALGLLARSDLAGGTAGSPARVGRLLVHRLTGR